MYARNTLADENPNGLITVAEGFERSGDYRGARALYAQAMAVFDDGTPQHLTAKIAFARTGALIGMGDQSVVILMSALQELEIGHPQRDQVLRELTQVHVAANRFATALSQISQVSAMSVADMVQAGTLQHVKGSVERADQLFNDALNRAPQNRTALRAGALSFALKGDYAAAVALLGKVFDAPSSASSGQNSLADIYALSGQRQAALSILKETYTAEQLQEADLLYRLLPRFTANERSAYLFFGVVPKSALATFDDNAAN